MCKLQESSDGRCVVSRSNRKHDRPVYCHCGQYRLSVHCPGLHFVLDYSNRTQIGNVYVMPIFPLYVRQRFPLVMDSLNFAVDASFDCKGYSWLFLPDDFLKWQFRWYCIACGPTLCVFCIGLYDLVACFSYVLLMLLVVLIPTMMTM